MGMLYQPKYRNGAGDLVKSSVWWFKVYVNGKPVRVNSRTTNKRQAEKEMKLREADAVRNVPVIPTLNTKTVADILGDVLIDYRNQGHDSTDKAAQRIRDHLGPFFGRYNAAGVTDQQVQDYIAARLKACAKRSTINRELALLKRAYKLNERVVTVRPAIPIAKEKNARTGFFDRADFERVRAALPDYLRPLLTVAYITGWRINSELLPMEWRQVDFAKRTLRLDAGTTKNDEPRLFPFSRELAAALEEQRAFSERVARERGCVIRYVFHYPDGGRVKYWRRRWLRALLQVGLATREADAVGKPKKGGKIIPTRIPHDFRRTAIHNLSNAGVSEAIAMKLCGHETRSVFDRYNIVTNDDLQRGVGKLDESAPGTVTGTVTPISDAAPVSRAAN